jgi:Uma2 family endonuclease
MGMVYSESMSHTAAEDPPRHRYTVADYYRMGEVGILAPDARVELIDGEIIDVAPPGDLHAGTVDQLVHVLSRAIGAGALVRVQSPLRLDDHSEPQPDITLLKARRDFFKSRAPRPADALLVVEVAASSLRFDRDVKIPLYAQHGVPEVWLVDLRSQRLIRYRSPRQGTYALIDNPTLDEPLAISALPAARIDLGALFAHAP